MDRINFNRIFDTYEKPIYNYVLRMVKYPMIAEELTQDIFINVYENLQNFRSDSKLSTWIYKIATNQCMDYFRTASHKHEEKTKWLEENDLINYSSSADVQKIISIEEQLIKSEMGECIGDFINTLPEDYRVVIVLHDLQGFKNREIAEIINSSLGTVKIRLHRARKKLRNVLAENCNFYQDKNNQLCCDKKQN